MNNVNDTTMESLSFDISNLQEVIGRSLHFADQFEHFCLLQPNEHQHGFQHTLAIGGRTIVNGHASDQLNVLKNFFDQNTKQAFGYFSYDIKNTLEDLTSTNQAIVSFPELFFFEPEILIHFNTDYVTIVSDDPKNTWNQITAHQIKKAHSQEINNLSCDLSEHEYIKRVSQLRNHLANGDIYEINYCMQFYGKSNNFNPIEAFIALTEYSPTPFSCLVKNESRYLVSASPERFMKKEGDRLISQPIKGTAPRGKSKEEDLQFISELRDSKKEQAENLMVVDLVRNDLSQSAKTGSVKVDELCGIYSFKQVHQMISTISCELDQSCSPLDAILNAFPMASMTGMPKTMAMKLIDRYENHNRSLFSGAVGYFNAAGDFDFNVVIRSILFDRGTNKVVFPVGSAITFESKPEKEYQECLLKARAILELFQAEINDN